MNTGHQLMAVLQRYLQPTTARIVMQSCLDPLNKRLEDLTPELVPRVAQTLVNATRHFVQPRDRDQLVAALKAFTTVSEQPAPRTIQILQENDLSVARITARDLAEALGAGSFQTQKAATAVSELARNILNYAQRGQIELQPSLGPPAKLRIVATDSGKGIPNLEEILSGRYRSKTGMGLGLLGVKRMVDRFHIETSPSGTRIEVELFA